MMAEKPVLNKAAINAATAKKAAATAKATAAKAVGEPIAKKVLPTIPKTAAALNALAKAMQGNDKKAIAKAQADAKAAIAANKSAATKEELALAKQSTLDYEKYLGEAEGISIPEAEYASEESRSAYDLLTLELTNMGLSSLITPLKNLFERGVTDADTLRLELSQTPEYKARFSANETRLKQGLRALSPAEYIKMEDQYQEIMRNYGLPASYYTKDSTGKQPGFDTLLGNDVSAVELEDRMMVAQNRVLKANPEVLSSLKSFYGDTITNGDILAYTLNPEKGLEDIKRKVTAAEISGAAQAAGLNKITKETSLEKITGMRTRAEELAAAGVTKETAQQQYGTIAELADRGGTLSSIYKTSPYGQTEAEAEIFNVAGQNEAARQRKKLTSLETAAFSGQAGVGALARERAGNL
jgi:hypothetical protein